MYRITTLEEVQSLISVDTELGVDTETIGLYGKIRTIQFYQRHWPEALIVENPNPILLYAMFKQTEQVTHVYQAVNYDTSTYQTQMGSRYQPENWEDTLLLSRLALPHLTSFSLDDVMEAVLGFDPYKRHGINKPEMQKMKWDVPTLTDKQLTYAAIDVYYLLDVFDNVKEFVGDISYKIDKAAMKRALDFQNNGLPVVQDRLSDLHRANQKLIDSLNMPINPNSYQQVRKYLDLPPDESSDGLVIAEIALTSKDKEQAAKARAIREWKKADKLNSFLRKFQTDEGRIYGRFAPTARSGRFTCKDQNLEQLPRKSKGCFGFTPGEGRVLLYSDYAQLELRTIAAITRERVLVDLFKSGGDPHAYVAEALFGPNWTKDDRQVVKTYNFNLLYVGGAGMVQSIFMKDHFIYRDIDVIRRDARKWKQAWPAIAAWQQEVIRSHRRGSLRQTPLGRRYLGKRVTDHANIENQGFGADIAKLAMHYMYDDITAEGAMMDNFIHDSYILEMEQDETANRKVAKIMKEAMQEAWFEGCKSVPVKDIPMPVDVMCGYNWGDIEEGDYLFKV